jgi:uncharacterized protein YaiI (UPF0178 family)
MKRIVLGLMAAATLAVAAPAAIAQPIVRERITVSSGDGYYYRHRHMRRVCTMRHHHRVCRMVHW